MLGGGGNATRGRWDGWWTTRELQGKRREGREEDESGELRSFKTWTKALDEGRDSLLFEYGWMGL